MDPTALEKKVEEVAKEVEAKEERKPRAGAETVALEMGLIKPNEVYGDLPPRFRVRGYYARVGQYVKVIKGFRRDGQEYVAQRIDMSEVINASLRGGIKLHKKTQQET